KARLTASSPVKIIVDGVIPLETLLGLPRWLQISMWVNGTDEPLCGNLETKGEKQEIREAIRAVLMGRGKWRDNDGPTEDVVEEESDADPRAEPVSTTGLPIFSFGEG